jgi:glutathione synthase/RimK-type ligase-like ATP-grasp enzyme
VPVPDWIVLTPGTTLDPAAWGPYVVVKPTSGRAGEEVRIKKTGRVRYTPASAFPSDHPIHQGPMMAQRFVYTGRWPVSYRVCTFLGRALYCLRMEQSRERRPLESRFGFAGAAGGDSKIIAASLVSKYSLVNDEEVISLAERAHRLAFPDYPYLGFDLLRDADDADTGEVSVIEANSGGAILHLSSWRGRAIQEKHGIDFYAQFGALDVAAERLIEVTRRRAVVAPLGRSSEPFRRDRRRDRDAPLDATTPTHDG